ncbi:hypothetical protein KAR48_10900 [bacterium]|nr:hypothetical protein [bacterium]
MKIKLAVVLLCAVSCALYAQDDITVQASSSGVGDGLDLTAVGELFKASEDLEDFEHQLNDPDKGYNNLDLNEDGHVDYIRVMEETSDDTRIIILQALLGEDECQDVASIEIEKRSSDDVQMQVHGDEDIYGPDIYYVPVASVHTWPIVVRLYGPAYRPWRSGYYWGYYPPKWRPWRPVKLNVYRSRHVHIHARHSFSVVNRPRVRNVHKVTYTRRRSSLVKHRVVARPAGKRTVIKKTTVKRPAKVTKTTTVKRGRNTVKKKTVVKKSSQKRVSSRKATVKRKK